MFKDPCEILVSREESAPLTIPLFLQLTAGNGLDLYESLAHDEKFCMQVIGRMLRESHCQSIKVCHIGLIWNEKSIVGLTIKAKKAAKLFRRFQCLSIYLSEAGIHGAIVDLIHSAQWVDAHNTETIDLVLERVPMPKRKKFVGKVDVNPTIQVYRLVSAGHEDRPLDDMMDLQFA